MSTKICHVLYPGAFKPVHYGHIALMNKYLNSKEYSVKLTVIISRSPREGISAETSKWFLEQVFRGNLNINIIISPDSSPVKTVYNMMCTKAFGDGIYAMGSSAKGNDIKKAEKIVDEFVEGGKYYTPGVKVIFFPINPTPITYLGRNDLYVDTPISSTIVRNDIRNGRYDMFRTAYIPLLQNPRIISEDILKTYYEMISKEVLPIGKQSLNSSLKESLLDNYFSENCVLNEGGAAGHMSHPYDYPELTFRDLKTLIHDLFAGSITDVTEKLDGQNLFASVDEHGNTIFARNEKTLKEQPWYLEDVMHNPKWIGTPSVQHAFTNAALTIDKIFKNIPKAVEFFNYDDKADGIRYRYWLNLEIIDTENFNVVPYADSKVSFHSFVVTCFDYSEIDKISKPEEDANCPDWDKFNMDEEQNKEKMAVLQKAIDKTTRTVFKAQITPEVIFKKLQDGEVKAQKYYQYIDKLLDKVGMSDKLTIREYKALRMIDYVTNSKELYWLDGEVLDAMIDRWVDNTKKPSIITIGKTCKLSNQMLMSKEQYSILNTFDKDYSKDAIKIIMKPLDTLFIKVGTEVLKRMEGFSNQGREKEVQAKLRKTLSDIKDAVESNGNEQQKKKLENQLARLADIDNEVCSTEGIVLKWHGRIMKITGLFAPINQIMSFENRKILDDKKKKEEKN